MRSVCRRCGRTFSGMTAFDAHWAKVPMRPRELCRHPMDVGLERKANGVWGAPAGEFDRTPRTFIVRDAES
jgi:hypothetical protein